jgi:lauroyl/myristoyl acyltransferase
MKHPLTLKHRFEYFIVQAIVQTLGNLSLGAATRVGTAIARFAGMRTSLRRRAFLNLAIAMPELR